MVSADNYFAYALAVDLSLHMQNCDTIWLFEL